MASVNVMECPSPSAVFMEHFMDCVESLPEDIQRNISQLRELDLLYRSKLIQISTLLDSYNTCDDPATKQKLLTKIQRCLIKSQEYGDEKLQLVSQIVDLTDNRNAQIIQDAENIDAPMRREASPLVSKPDIPYTFDDQRPIEKNPQSKRPRRQKTSNERYVDIQEKHAKPEKVAKVEKPIKQEKTTKNEKKTAAKVSEKIELSESSAALLSLTNEANKKNNETAKKPTESNGKKKVVKKDAKKKNNAIKKKKKKEIQEDLPIDPDEPTYCSCNQVSYGEMIGCDNDDCPIEWFHFNCVNLTTKPKGKWYCPDCTIERREKGKK
eukprot:gene17834-19617_t